MESKHTQGKAIFKIDMDDADTYYMSCEKEITEEENVANAWRLGVLWNAMDGLTNEEVVNLRRIHDHINAIPDELTPDSILEWVGKK